MSWVKGYVIQVFDNKNPRQGKVRADEHQKRWEKTELHRKTLSSVWGLLLSFAQPFSFL
jgi:hypothetical protein